VHPEIHSEPGIISLRPPNQTAANHVNPVGIISYVPGKYIPDQLSSTKKFWNDGYTWNLPILPTNDSISKLC